MRGSASFSSRSPPVSSCNHSVLPIRRVLFSAPASRSPSSSASPSLSLQPLQLRRRPHLEPPLAACRRCSAHSLISPRGLLHPSDDSLAQSRITPPSLSCFFPHRTARRGDGRFVNQGLLVTQRHIPARAFVRRDSPSLPSSHPLSPGTEPRLTASLSPCFRNWNA